MNAVLSAESAITDLTKRLTLRPSQCDGYSAYYSASGPLAMQRMIKDLITQLGQPSQYCGGAGPIVRWHTGSHTVTLDTGEGHRIRLSACQPRTLEEVERARFAGLARRGALTDEALPYLWRFQPSGEFDPAPATPLAQDWAELEVALEALLRDWCQSLELLLGNSAAGFTIDHGDGNLVLMVDPGDGMENPGDGVAVFADSRAGADRDSTHRTAMKARGWQSFLPVLSYWEAYFDRTRDGSAAAAQLVVNELRARGVDTPGSLRLIRASAGTPAYGKLDVPGAGIAPGPPQ